MFSGFIPQGLVLRSIVLGWISIYRNWAIEMENCNFLHIFYTPHCAFSVFNFHAPHFLYYTPHFLQSSFSTLLIFQTPRTITHEIYRTSSVVVLIYKSASRSKLYRNLVTDNWKLTQRYEPPLTLFQFDITTKFSIFTMAQVYSAYILCFKFWREVVLVSGASFFD